MAERHPDELALLSFVEEELDEDARRDVAEHLVGCRACSDHVRRLETARAALRGAPPLELSESRRAEILAALPERRDPWRLFRPARRVLVLAAPVAAAALVAGALVLSVSPLDGGGGGGDNDEAASAEATDAAGAATATREDAAGGEGGGSEAAPVVPQADQAAPVRSVRGPVAEVVRVLRDAGIPARAEASGSVRADAPAADVRAALAGRPDGGVAVYVR